MAEKTRQIFSNLEKNLGTEGAELVDKVKGVIVFDVSDKKWTLDLTSGTGSLKEGDADSADLTLSMTDENFEKLVSGKLNPQQAFLFRKLKIKGSMAKAMKVSPVLEAAKKQSSKL